MDNKVVYIHINKNTREVFYVGVGKPRRANDFTCRSKKWFLYTEQNGLPDVLIIAENISKDEAYRTEINLIKKYGRRDYEGGTLLNDSTGGMSGSNGIKAKPETIKKKSDFMKKNNPSKSDEVKKIISEKTKIAMHREDVRKKHMDACKSIEFRKKVSERTKAAFTDEIRKLISDKVKASYTIERRLSITGENSHRSRAIVMKCNCGIEIEKFSNCYEAARKYKIRAGGINMAVRGHRKTYKGLNWDYKQ